MARIHVLGASGSGTTTTAKALAKELNYVHLDTDNYFWEPTDIPFTKKREVQNRIKLLEQDLQKNTNVILSGIFYPWGSEELTKYFDYLVCVKTDKRTRRKRLILREYEMYGERMLEGGDMYEQFNRFLKWALNYENNTNDDIGEEKTEEWIKATNLKTTYVDGTKTIEEIIREIKRELEQIREGR